MLFCVAHDPKVVGSNLPHRNHFLDDLRESRMLHPASTLSHQISCPVGLVVVQKRRDRLGTD